VLIANIVVINYYNDEAGRTMLAFVCCFLILTTTLFKFDRSVSNEQGDKIFQLFT
jgi:hypothetical protein